MSIYKTEIQLDGGEVVHPHTSADVVFLNNKNLKSNNVAGALEELFSYANNYKSTVAEIIGEPITATDTANKVKSKILSKKSKWFEDIFISGVKGIDTQDSLTRIIDKLTNKVSSLSNEVSSLNKDINGRFKFAKGEISFPDNAEVTGLSFKPLIIYISGLNYYKRSMYPIIYIYVDNKFIEDKEVCNNWYTTSFYSDNQNRPIIEKKGLWVKENGFQAYDVDLYGKNAKLTWIALGE